MKPAKIAYLIILPVIFLSYLAYSGYNFFFKHKYNILILSTCSLRADQLDFYGGPAKTPNMSAIASKAFVFNNGYTDMSWSNVSGFLSKLTVTDMRDAGYQGIGRPWYAEDIGWQKKQDEDNVPYYFRSPNPKVLTNGRPSRYEDDLLEIKGKILDRKSWPFLFEFHNRMVHFPYGFNFNSEKIIKNMISEPSRAYVRDYEKDYKKYPERLPFGFYFMENLPMYEELIKEFKIGKAEGERLKNSNSSTAFIGTLNNKAVLEKWKKSKFFKTDLAVIKEMYQRRIELYDESLGPILNLYNDPELAKNTVIIFTGDHGEAFFEHDYMVHGETIYDEMIRFPFFIKFPGQTKSVKFDNQFYQQTIFTIVRKIMNGELNANTFEEFAKKEGTTDFIFSRTCANDIQSIRYKNEWKLIQNFKLGKKTLFNLKSDPGELNDVYEKNPDIGSFLTEKSAEVAANQTNNRMLHECTSANN